MSWDNPGDKLSLKTASVVGQCVAVAALPLASVLDETVVVAGSLGQQIIGMTEASAGAGDELAVIYNGVAKARAAASVGAFSIVGVASTNGALGPIAPSGVIGSVNGSAGIQAARFKVGRALTSAAAGEYFACHVDPGQIV